MNAHAKWLLKAAEEIRAKGHAGWGNTCEQAAMAILASEKWQTIKTAPKDGSRFLAFNETMRVYEVVGWWKRGRLWTDAGSGVGLIHKQFNKNYFSHWMSLPEPPTCPKST